MRERERAWFNLKNTLASGKGKKEQRGPGDSSVSHRSFLKSFDGAVRSLISQSRTSTSSVFSPMPFPLAQGARVRPRVYLY